MSGGEDQNEQEAGSEDNNDNSSSEPEQPEFFHIPTNLITFV